MVKWLAVFLILTSTVNAVDKLSDVYLIHYGDSTSEIKVVEYFSFMCPHCISLFRQEFKQLKSSFIDNGKVHFTFHPLPVDKVTVSAMECLSKLTESEKRAFLEVFFEEGEADEPEMTIALMEKAMELFKKPILELTKKEYLQNTKSFSDAFEFIKQKESIDNVPAVEINGTLFANEVPDIDFLQSEIKKMEKVLHVN